MSLKERMATNQRVMRRRQPTTAMHRHQMKYWYQQLQLPTTKRRLKQQSHKPPNQPKIQQPKSGTQQLPTTKDVPVLLRDSLPSVWKKSDRSVEQTGKFSWNGPDSVSLPDMEPCGYFYSGTMTCLNRTRLSQSSMPHSKVRVLHLTCQMTN